MAQVPIEELLKQCPSMYKLVGVAAKRAKELTDGSPKLVDVDTKKIATIALEEIRQGKVFLPEDDDDKPGAKSGAKRSTKAKKKKS